MIKEISSQRRC